MKNKNIQWVKAKEAKFDRIQNKVWALNLKNFSEYEQVRRIKKLPSRPEREFADYGWNGWMCFLGCETKLAMFARVKKEVQQASIENYWQYEAVRNEKNWPSRPKRDFTGYGWKGWENFFGKKLLERKIPTSPETRVPFGLIKEQVKKLGIQKYDDYTKEAKKHADWPSSPHIYHEYTTFEEFAQPSSKYISLDQLCEEVQKCHIVLKKDYQTIRHKKNFIHWPPDPTSYYLDWKNWSDLIGKEFVEPIKKTEILPYVILKYFVKKAGIKSYSQYHQERKKHKGWVSNPYRHYKKTGEWVSYPDLFGIVN